MNALEAMDEAASKGGSSVRFAENDEKLFKIVKDPEVGVSKFPKKDGSPKQEFRFTAIESTDPKTERIWFVTNWQVIQQLVAHRKRMGLNTFVGCVFYAKVQNKSSMNPVWFVDLKDWPGKQAQPQGQVLRSPAQPTPAPVAQDSGVAWLEGQKAGATTSPGGQ